MHTHDGLYKKIGIRKDTDFINPKVIIDSEFVFPTNSELYWFKASNIAECPHYDTGYIAGSKKPHIVSKYKYDEPTGNFTSLESKVKSVVKEQQKQQPKFKFLKPGFMNIKINKQNLIIYNYGIITALHKYRPDRMSNLYKWSNAFNTMVTDIKRNFKPDNTRHKYVLIDIPVGAIPNRNTFEKYTSVNNSEMLKDFPTYNYLTLLEFWRFLTPKVTELTKLYKIKVSMLKDITFILKHNNKIVLLNLAVLVGAVKNFKYSSSVRPMSSDIVKKLFLILIMKINIESGKSILELEQKTNLGTNAMSNDTYDVSKVDEKDLDKLLSDNEEEVDEGADYDQDNDTMIEDMIDDLDLVITAEYNVEEFNSVKELKDSKKDGKKDMLEKIELMKRNKDISSATYNTYKEHILKQETKTSPFENDNTLLKDVMKYDHKDFVIDDKDMSIPDINIIKDKEALKDPINAINNTYVNKVYKKDKVNTVMSLQNSNIIVKDYDVTVTENILGGTETHTVYVQPLGGKPSKVVIHLPVIDENGEFKVSGNRYKLRKQRGDIVIRKIKASQVSLTTYFGKTFISKAVMKKDDAGFWFRKQILAASKVNDSITNLVFFSKPVADIDVPVQYSIISRYVGMFNIGNDVFNFDYNNRYKMLKDIDISKIEDKKHVLIGKRGGGKYIVMDFNNDIFEYDKGKLKPMTSIYDRLKIDASTMPIEYASIKIFKANIPVGLLLAYYLGFNKLLKVLKTKFQIMERGKRYTLQPNEYVILFKDVKYIFNKDDLMSTSILGGIASLNNKIKGLEVILLDKRESFPVVFNNIGYAPLYINEIKLMENMFIDPISLSVLQLMKEPETFKGLLIRSVELLLDDNYKDPNNIDGAILKGYDRIPGMMYTTLVNAVRDQQNKNSFTKSPIVVNPYEVWGNVNNDSTTMLVDDLNPIAALKQVEDVTYLGNGGRSKETMNENAREFNQSEVGIISEAVKDSGDVGISVFMSANPQLDNVRGVNLNKRKKPGPSNIFSTSAMLAPVTDKDDGKRTNFVSIQNSHTIPMNKMRVPAVRTGYEAILPYRVDAKYCVMAKEDGKVMKVDDRSIEVMFKSGKRQKINLGSWHGKEEAGVSYKHTVITDLKKGNTFKRGNTITYDKAFFEPDIFDKTRVIFKTGSLFRISLVEVPETYEDSTSLSKKSSKDFATNIIKSKSFVLKNESGVYNMVKVGDKVEPNDPLFTITDIDMGENEKQFDDKSLAILQNIKNKNPKAKLRGTIDHIRVFYNCELKEMSPSLRKLAKLSDAMLAKEQMKDGMTGRVNNSYSIKGRPLIEDEVEVKIYISTNVEMSTGDKGVVSNQLKSTIGEIYDYDVKTADDGIDVDGMFSTRSIAARIVTSASIVGTTTTLLRKVSEGAVNMYFK